jgi:aminopeptidase N
VPKPCYLFSAVAGDLALREDSHTTRSTGRVVALRTYVPPAYAGQLDVAVTAIKAAMVWDEAAFGREYDLVSSGELRPLLRLA